MAIILNIDTAISTASVCLSKEDQSLQFALNSNHQDHASWLHVAIKNVIAEAGMGVKDLEAMAVTIGPGSYTGLRVGLSTAKGLCFALGIPLICINTLEVMAYAVRNEEANLVCPVIDARRMEVFMAVYNKNMETIVSPCAMIIEENSFNSMLVSGKIIFSGNGSEKIKKVVCHPNAIFENSTTTAADMVKLSENKFVEKKFADTAYTEPFYIKEFYSPAH
ncbi:MAG: tRNA (adenosine(37)-N6)-threonylcarbamoyltransferase complex dimerization subunit type 1 TsaB [Chitinophagaceae bacterium]